MRKRLMHIFGFFMCSLGWFFISCTMAMDAWKIAQIGGMGGSNIIKVAWYWSNLWKDCFLDSTDVTNCREYDVLWAVTPYVQGVRGLLMIGLTLGLVATILAFVGMECTYMGGSEITKDKVLFAGSVLHVVGGVSDITGYCVYINRVAKADFSQRFDPNSLQYALGIPVFMGLVGCFLIFLGSSLYAATVVKSVFSKRVSLSTYNSKTYSAPRSRSRTVATGYTMSRQPRQSRLNMQARRTGTSGASRISEISSLYKYADGKLSLKDTFV